MITPKAISGRPTIHKLEITPIIQLSETPIQLLTTIGN